MLAGASGFLLLIYLIRRAGPDKLAASIAAVGWGICLVIALAGLAHIMKTWAWRLILTDDRRHVSFPRMLGLRLGSEAVGQLGVLGQVFGETLRVSLLSSKIPITSGVTSVALDRALFILSAAIVTALGTVAALFVLPLPHHLSVYAEMFAFALLIAVLVTALAVRRRWPIISGTAGALGRIRYFSGWINGKLSVIRSVEGKLLDFCHHRPRAFWSSFALNLACHGAAVLEVYLILRLMRVNIDIYAALAVEALTKLVNVAGMFNPGNIGTYEGGNMLIARMLGMSATTGLTLAFARRFRGIFWAGVGAVCLVFLSKAKKRGSPDNINPSLIQIPEKIQPASGTPAGNEPAHRSHIAVILANGSGGGGYSATSLPQVGALPVLLRAILGARKAGAARIVVVTDPATGPSARRELLRTGRLPETVEWIEPGEERSLPSLMARLLDEKATHLVLVDGDCTFHPSLQQRAGEWNGEGALALVTDGQLVGIYALSASVALDLAAIDFVADAPASAGSFEQIDAWVTSTQTVERVTVPENQWQRILTPQDRLVAERKLDGWLVKPTDGIFARMNRRVSIPISRQIIRFPITPNMVSIFTLGVSFLSGLYFAFGGYRNMLIGALLGLFASILDGCDGEVARLKLQESAFGCWLETICDYLYYLFMFTGMTIGLLRSSGMHLYLVWGGLLLFGALASFLVTGWQRHRLAAGRPEQLLGIWHAQATRRRSNPFLYFGRHTEFIVRRCFLPYAILFFALFNITNVAFILAALGANLVWSIALYSHFRFSVAPSTAIGPPASA